MTINAISSLQRSLYTGNDAALLVTPAMGSSATTIVAKPLIPEGTLETGFQNDARNSGQPALAKIVEILDLMRPRSNGAPDEAETNPAHEDSVRAVSAFLDSLNDMDTFSQGEPAFLPQDVGGATGQSALESMYRQF